MSFIHRRVREEERRIDRHIARAAIALHEEKPAVAADRIVKAARASRTIGQLRSLLRALGEPER